MLMDKKLIEGFQKFKNTHSIEADVKLSIPIEDYLQADNDKYKEIFKENQEFINKYINNPKDLLYLISYTNKLLRTDQKYLAIRFFSIYFQYCTRLNHDKKTTRKNKTN
jgi:hypothetical protein